MKLIPRRRKMRTLSTKVWSRFFSDFNPMRDRRTKTLRRRLRRKAVDEINSKKEEDENPVNESVALNPVPEKASLYDSEGVLLQSGLDLCDCLEDSCPGCHLPCSNCSSPKCGHLCRSGRHWQYTSVVQDGFPRSKVLNIHLVSMSS